ncbi:hypothetical protein AB0I53_18705 [Saccharopolyspora sp. NPDC050389]|uniref:hypothetical protein n=1 Tax=Saccharopolyspora sp. NPDC050389 TaxID=3155516 RepID=UPI0033E806B6
METVQCLRVRERDGFAEITYKPASNAATHNTADIITKPETNVSIGADQAKQANQLLAAIGMVQLARVAKTRIALRHATTTPWPSRSTRSAASAHSSKPKCSPTMRPASTSCWRKTEYLCGFHQLPMVHLPYRDLPAGPVQQLDERDDDLATARATNRELMALNTSTQPRDNRFQPAPADSWQPNPRRRASCSQCYGSCSSAPCGVCVSAHS